MVEFGRHRRLKISRLVRAGSSPATRTKNNALVAQWSEQWTHNPLVTGSSPVGRTT